MVVKFAPTAPSTRRIAASSARRRIAALAIRDTDRSKENRIVCRARTGIGASVNEGCRYDLEVLRGS
jgi:hypothetical protein